MRSTVTSWAQLMLVEFYHGEGCRRGATTCPENLRGRTTRWLILMVLCAFGASFSHWLSARMSNFSSTSFCYSMSAEVENSETLAAKTSWRTSHLPPEHDTLSTCDFGMLWNASYAKLRPNIQLAEGPLHISNAMHWKHGPHTWVLLIPQNISS